MAKLSKDTLGEIETIVVTDSTDFYALASNTDGAVIMLCGWDGANYRILKVNTSGQLEVECKGSV